MGRRLRLLGGKAVEMGAGGAAVPFSPIVRTNLHSWWKADAGTFADAAMTTAATADGTAVLGLADQSGLGHNATKAAVPGLLLTLNAQNGLPALRGDGTAKFLITADFAAPLGDRTIYFAGQSNGVAYNYFIDGKKAGEENGLSTAGSFLAWVIDAGAPQSGGTPSVAWHIFTLRVDTDGNDILRVDGSEVINAEAGGQTTLQIVLMGRYSGAAAQMDGDFGECVVISGLDSVPQMAQMEAYLTNRWL